MVVRTIGNWVCVVAIVAFTPTVFGSEFSPRECRGLFHSSVALDISARVAAVETTAASEAASAIERWKNPSLTPPKKPSYPLAPFGQKATGPSRLHFETRQASFTTLFDDLEFYRKGAEPGAPLNLVGSPKLNAIAQIEVTRDSIVLIRPNVERGVFSSYGTGPIRARLNSDGSFSGYVPLFADPRHRIRSLNPAEFQYELSINHQTSVARAVMTLRERPHGDYTGVPMGLADVFFVSPTTGKEYPSLAAESGYQFSNVVAISDTLYIAEIANRSLRGSKGETVLFEYDPGDFIFRRLMEFPPSPPSPDSLATIFRRQENRRVAHGEIGIDHLLKIFTQTHQIEIALPDPDGDFRGELKIYPNPKATAKPVSPDLAVGRNRMTIKVVSSEPQQPKEVYDMMMLTGDRSHEKGVAPTAKTYVALREGSTTVSYWSVKADRLSPVFYRVKGGFVAQRDGQNTGEATAEFPRGELHGLIFLSDAGGVYDITERNIQGYGALSILEGHIFIVGPGGEFMNIESAGMWR